MAIRRTASSSSRALRPPGSGVPVAGAAPGSTTSTSTDRNRRRSRPSRERSRRTASVMAGRRRGPGRRPLRPPSVVALVLVAMPLGGHPVAASSRSGRPARLAAWPTWRNSSGRRERRPRLDRGRSHRRAVAPPASSARTAPGRGLSAWASKWIIVIPAPADVAGAARKWHRRDLSRRWCRSRRGDARTGDGLRLRSGCDGRDGGGPLLRSVGPARQVGGAPWTGSCNYVVPVPTSTDLRARSAGRPRAPGSDAAVVGQVVGEADGLGPEAASRAVARAAVERRADDDGSGRRRSWWSRSSRSAAGTPANVASGPYMLPSRMPPRRSPTPSRTRRLTDRSPLSAIRTATSDPGCRSYRVGAEPRRRISR